MPNRAIIKEIVLHWTKPAESAKGQIANGAFKISNSNWIIIVYHCLILYIRCVFGTIIQTEDGYMKKSQKNVVVDFIKSFSCVYSITKNLSESFGVEHDPLLLNSVVGFSSGISTMGDTCGVANGGAMVISKKYASLSSNKIYLLCSEYFSRLEQKVNTPDCGIVHGGKHLTKDFRRAILTGKALKCAEILYHGTDILEDLSKMADKNNFSFAKPDKRGAIKDAASLFEQENFHCCQSVIDEISRSINIPKENIELPAKGFIGGIGCNGTLCGAISGGVLCLGIANNVEISKSGYKDAMKIITRGLIVNDDVFEDEKHFKPARLFTQCKTVYKEVEDKFGHTHCHKILGCRLDEKSGIEQYKKGNKIDLCRDVAKIVTKRVQALLN